MWSSCFNSPGNRQQVLDELGDKISLSIVDFKFAVQQSFNFSVIKSIENFGEADGYLYVASDILLEDKNTLKKLSIRLKNKENGIISPEINNDNGYSWWFDFPEDKNIFDIFDKSKDFIVPLGATANLHCALFSNKIYKEYGNILPDIFTSYCGESIFNSLVSAIQQKFIITNDIIAIHRDKQDVKGQSIANVDGQTKVFGAGWDRIYPGAKRTIKEIISDPLAYEVGLSYETWVPRFKHKMDIPSDKPYLMPNLNCFDENGFCKDERLKEFIKENFYLSKDVLDYASVTSEFTKGE